MAGRRPRLLRHLETGHRPRLCFLLFLPATAPSGAEGDQMRRRLGGRQPLWGIGVTSLIEVIVKPAACNARRADSRPATGPFPSTSRVFTPCSCALRAAESAAICAA